MTQLIVTVGLPGSGKSTRARAWVAEDPTTRARINRDDLRTMLHGGRLGTSEQEQQVTFAGHGAVDGLLLSGFSVVCDDTNLRPTSMRGFEDLALHADADLVVWDMTDVPLEVCIARDAARTGTARVGEQVIRDMWQRYQDSRAGAR